MNQPIILVPTKEEVENLKVGDLALGCFGFAEVVKINYRGTDIKGKAYVGFSTTFGTNGASITGSYKEDELVRTLAITNKLNSHQCEDLEAQIVRERKAQTAS